MPILVAPTTTVPPETPDGPGWPPYTNAMPRVSFTDPAGAITMLTDWERGWIVQPGAKGLDMPGYAITQDESPGIDGYEIRQVRALGKEIILPIAFWANDSRDAYLQRRRQFIRSLNPKRGPGTLTLAQPDGATRTIGAIYAGGLEGDESRDAAGERWCINVITFACPSPYWIGAEAAHEWRNAEAGEWLPVLPLVVGDSEVLGSVTVDNPGDDDAYPIWTIQGPATSISLTNETTGESLLLTRTITDGDEIVIDTRQRRQTALLNGVTNLWPDIDDDSTMWALTDGINNLSLTVAGSTTDTTVRMTYQPRYLAA
ncbi:phage tail domain-containing protein [Streptomyces sp. 4R-3d]|uniref:phage distal tail protein n=1 Tax=Streptomyces sp. 4R-3d TaxID=2559605 RepID=UPI001FFE1513|nr:phage tail domain-containing protein [Streptomyces sp. 4R-3d]